MNSKQLFTVCYTAHLDFEKSIETFSTIGVSADNSLFSNAFYTLFDEMISQTLTEDGLIYFYEEILFEDYSLDEAIEALEEYFIN